MTRFPRDIMSVQKSTSEVGRFSTTSSPAAQNCSISMTSKGDIYTKKSPILNLQKSWVVNLCPFYRMVKVWIRFGHRWISGHIVNFHVCFSPRVCIYTHQKNKGICMVGIPPLLLLSSIDATCCAWPSSVLHPSEWSAPAEYPPKGNYQSRQSSQKVHKSLPIWP